MFQKLKPSERVVVAVSGGVDSMALVWLSKQYFKNMIAVTIDHHLRPESSSEAKRVCLSIDTWHWLTRATVEFKDHSRILLSF